MTYMLRIGLWIKCIHKACQCQCLIKKTFLDFIVSYTQGSTVMHLPFIQTMPITKKWQIIEWHREIEWLVVVQREGKL
jgi:hypothetical protein